MCLGKINETDHALALSYFSFSIDAISSNLRRTKGDDHESTSQSMTRPPCNLSHLLEADAEPLLLICQSLTLDDAAMLRQQGVSFHRMLELSQQPLHRTERTSYPSPSRWLLGNFQLENASTNPHRYRLSFNGANGTQSSPLFIEHFCTCRNPLRRKIFFEQFELIGECMHCCFFSFSLV